MGIFKNDDQKSSQFGFDEKSRGFGSLCDKGLA